MTVALSICIPTFNRSECLKECLSSILLAVAGHEDCVEIVISNNASTDATEEVVKSFQELSPLIRYHKNVFNIGGDRNIYAVAAMGTGKYIWVFGDDDKMAEGAIATVLGHINIGYDLVICNYSIWDKSFSFRKRNDALGSGKKQVFENCNDLLQRFSLHLGYISSVVINRDVFFNLSSCEYFKFIDYGFSFMYAVYAGCAQGKCISAYIADPIVLNRSGNSGDYDWCKYMVIGSSLIFDSLQLNGYATKSVATAKHKVFVDFILPNMIYLKLRNDYDSIRVIGLLFNYYKKYWLFWICCVPVWLVPAFTVRFAKFTVSAVRTMDIYKKVGLK